jgi:hypothetical protein
VGAARMGLTFHLRVFGRRSILYPCPAQVAGPAMRQTAATVAMAGQVPAVAAVELVSRPGEAAMVATA